MKGIVKTNFTNDTDDYKGSEIEIPKTGNPVIDDIVSLHEKIKKNVIDFGNSILTNSIKIGKLLNEVKQDLINREGHGHFESWIKDNLPFEERQAQKYLRIYNNREALKANQEFAFQSVNGIIKSISNPKSLPEPKKKDDSKGLSDKERLIEEKARLINEIDNLSELIRKKNKRCKEIDKELKSLPKGENN